jgi:dihydrofolate reductase
LAHIRRLQALQEKNRGADGDNGSENLGEFAYQAATQSGEFHNFPVLCGQPLRLVHSLPQQAKDGPQVICFHAFEKAVSYARASAEKTNREIFIVGGSQIYEEALKEGVVDRIIVSEIPGTHSGDTFFPELSEDWSCVDSTDYDKFRVVEYERG